MAQPADWYRDPTGRYQHRYWDGYQWTNQVSSGGPSAIDPNPLDPTAAATPPAPGSQASEAASQPEPAQPAVHVSQSSSGMGFGVILGALLALVAVVLLVVVLLSGSEDTTDTTVGPTPTEAPATTEAPAE